MQPLDHFDASDQRQYKQRYWVEQKFWKKPNGPVLLYIGGESSLIPEVIAGGKSGGEGGNKNPTSIYAFSEITFGNIIFNNYKNNSNTH